MESYDRQEEQFHVRYQERLVRNMLGDPLKPERYRRAIKIPDRCALAPNPCPAPWQRSGADAQAPTLPAPE